MYRVRINTGSNAAGCSVGYNYNKTKMEGLSMEVRLVGHGPGKLATKVFLVTKQVVQWLPSS